MTNEDIPENVVGNAQEDSDLTPAEKETTITFGNRDDTADVFTAEAGLMRRLALHPEASITSTVEKDGDVVGINAEIPVACLTVKASPRTTGGHANVITSSVLRD